MPPITENRKLIETVLTPYLPGKPDTILTIPRATRSLALETATSEVASYQRHAQLIAAAGITEAFFHVFLASYLVAAHGLFKHRVAIRHSTLALFGIDAEHDDFDSIDFCAGSVMIETLEYAERSSRA